MHKAIFLLLPAIAAVAQQNPSMPAGRELVQVGVTAQDRNGKPIADLRREDFQIFDNGVRQQITQFLENKPGAAPPSARPAGVFTNRPAAEPDAAYSVVWFDNLNTARAEQSFQALKAIPRGEKVAVYERGCQSMGVFRELTSGWDSLIPQLEASVRALHSCADQGGGLGHALTSIRPPSADTTQHEGQISPPYAPPVGYSSAPEDVADKEMQQLAVHLAGIPGRKSLIWVATNFRLNKSNLQRLLNANVAIYPVDAIGATNATARDKALHAAPLVALAAMTGGKAYVDRDDPDVAIGDALNDGQISYTLGFYRTGSNRNAAGDRIEVRPCHEGVVLRYRTSDLGAPKDRTPVGGVVDSVDPPLNPPAVPMTAAPTLTGKQMDLALTLDVSTLGLRRKKSGVWEGKAELFAYFETIDRKFAGKSNRIAMDFHLSPAMYAAALQNGFVFRPKIAIPPGTSKLHLELHHLISGKVGTLTIPLSEVETVGAPDKKQADSPGTD